MLYKLILIDWLIFIIYVDEMRMFFVGEEGM